MSNSQKLKIAIPILIVLILVIAVSVYTNRSGNYFKRNSFKSDVQEYIASNFGDRDFYIDYIDYNKTIEGGNFTASITSKSDSNIRFVILRQAITGELVDNYYFQVVVDRELSERFQRQVVDDLTAVFRARYPHLEILNVYAKVVVERGQFDGSLSAKDSGVVVDSIFIFYKGDRIIREQFMEMAQRATEYIRTEGYIVEEYILNYCFNEIMIANGKYVYEGFELIFDRADVESGTFEYLERIESIHIDI